MIAFKLNEDGLYTSRIGDLEVNLSVDGSWVSIYVYDTSTTAPCEEDNDGCPTPEKTSDDGSFCFNCPHETEYEDIITAHMTGYSSLTECERSIRDLFNRNWDGIAFDHDAGWPEAERKRFASEVWVGIGA